MRVQDLTITENPGKRTRRHENAVRVHMTPAYAANLVSRLAEKMAEGDQEFHVVLFGDIEDGS